MPLCGKVEMGSIFNIINVPFGYLIRWFNDFTGSYAIALLLFAIVVKLVMAPLSIKQQKTQIKQAKLKPLEAAIRKKYAGRTDKATQQKLQNDLLELYQEQGYSPFSGCLPLLIQFPIIISLYEIIRKPLTYICSFSKETLTTIVTKLNEWNGTAFTVETVQEIDLITALKELAANSAARFSELDALVTEELVAIENLNFKLFGFIDLSAKPEISQISWLWIIPVVVFFSSYFGMKLSRKFMPQQGAQAAMADQSAATSMKIMDFMMPAMSTWFCFMFSGAIGMYWIYQNVLNLVQTILLAKLMPLPTFTEEEYKEAERAYAGKAPKKNKNLDPNRERPRSLHYIDADDEDIPVLPGKADRYEDDEETEPEKKPFGEEAPQMKDDKNKDYKKKK